MENIERACCETPRQALEVLVKQKIRISGIGPVALISEGFQQICLLPGVVHIGDDHGMIIPGGILGGAGGDVVQIIVQPLALFVQFITGCGQTVDYGSLCFAACSDGFLGSHIPAQITAVTKGGGEDLVSDHVHGGESFNVQNLHIGFQLDLIPGPEFGFGEDAVLGDQVDVFPADEAGHGLGGAGVIAESPALGLLLPGIGVAVAVEEDPLMLGKAPGHQLLEGGIKIHGALQLVGKLLQLLGHDGVQGDVGVCNRLGRAQHTELKLVAGEGNGGGAVAVGGVLGNYRQHIHADLHHGLAGVGVMGPAS